MTKKKEENILVKNGQSDPVCIGAVLHVGSFYSKQLHTVLQPIIGYKNTPPLKQGVPK